MRPCPSCGYIEEQRIGDRRTSGFSYEQFSIFWKAYPRKVGKGAAEKVWAKLRGDEEMYQQILAAVENQKQGEMWKKENGIYIPHPATWLNQKRWEDEPVTAWKDPFQKPAFDPERIKQKEAELERLREREYQRIREAKARV